MNGPTITVRPDDTVPTDPDADKVRRLRSPFTVNASWGRLIYGREH